MKIRAKVIAFVAAGALMGGATMTLGPQSAQAKPEFAAQTQQPCGACHQNPAGGGKLKPFGEAFKANGFKLKQGSSAAPSTATSTTASSAPTSAATTPASTYVAPLVSWRPDPFWMPALRPAPSSVAEPFGWWYRGAIEAGGRAFLNDPSRNGTINSGEKSLAKYYEYSTIKPGPFLDAYLATGSKNGLYQADLYARNVGYSDQRYIIDLSKVGEHYLTLGWDQIPHVYSTSAQTLYGGVGTSALTLPAGLSNTLFGDAGCVRVAGQQPTGCVSGLSAVPATAAARAAAIQGDINRNLYQTDIGIRRDTASVEYRWTPTDAWDVRTDYSHLHRWGSQVDGVVFSPGTSGVRVDAPRPVDDTTQNFGINGEYAGSSSWGQKFTFKIAYNGSVYTDGLSSYTVQNPFCATATGASPGECARNGSPSSPLALMSTWPSNNANAFTATLGMDLPQKSRFMSTLSYTMMRQNQAFLPFAPTSQVFNNAGNTTLGNLPGLPATSLNGAINTLLSNNVLTTQITPSLKSKLSYRYYDFDNNTPELTFNDWVVTDVKLASVTNASYAPVRSISLAYTRQNAGAELTWHPTKEWNVGFAYGWEHYDRTRQEANLTNENSGKIYADWKPVSWVTARGSWLYAARRYDVYDYLGNIARFQWPNGTYGGAWYTTAYRQFFLDNRDRNKGQFSLAGDVARGLTVTPNGGWRNDDFRLNVPNEVGMERNHTWNAGVEVAYLMNPNTRLLFAYMYEHQSQVITSCSTISGVNPACNVAGFTLYTDNVEDKINTITVAVDQALIPSKLDLWMGYTVSHAIHAQPLYFNNGAGPTAATGGQYPDQKFVFQRFEALGTYKFSQEEMSRLGWKGELRAKLRYVWERNSVSNFQNDVLQPYMFSYIPATGYMTWMAFDNPNYNVHLLGASLAWSW
jgi:MtrB/PioB family decaheme-associated outer membrane protein